MKTELIAGIDLHSNNLMLGIIDQDGRRIRHKKLACELQQVVEFLDPFKDQLKQIVVESTFNWYWLVDGLHKLSYPVVLANPAKIDQYSGLKHADDKNDAFFLAELERLNILPTGYIYDAELRPVRDLLRRRMLLVGQRTALMLSFKSLYTRTTGGAMNLRRLKEMTVKEALELYEHSANQTSAEVEKDHIEQLSKSICKIERVVLKSARKMPYYAKLNTLPGIGVILGMTITMETGDVARFETGGNFASYCRTVKSIRTSNDKKKGENNGKCGNRYLAWAFVEAANFAKRYDERCRKWFDRKAAKTSNIIATKALACKLAKAAWHVMAKNVDYDPKRVFGG